MTEPIYCSQCETELTESEAYHFEDECLCLDCLDEQTFICDSCGNRHWLNDNYGGGNLSLCEACRDNYNSCVVCGRLIHADDTYYDEDDDDEYDPRCYSCHSLHETETYLHCYNYKPSPNFLGEGSRYFGVELEIDGGGKTNGNARILTELANRYDDCIYIKGDGSLDDGLEIVTHPMTLAYHKESMLWGELMRKALELGYRSHNTSTCGLHIHVSRNSLGDNTAQQDLCIGRILYFIERFWMEMLRFSRRTELQVQQWAARYGYKDNPQDILEHAKKGCRSRYTCVNLTNYDTIEFRIFRGSLKLNTLIAAVQMVDEICAAASLMTDDEFSRLSWCSFMERINAERCPELIAYLKERRLYINEPVAGVAEYEEEC